MKKQAKRNEDFSLRVAKAFIEDEGKGFARIDDAVLKSLGAVPGDALMITGRRSTVARAAQTNTQYAGQSLIQVDGITRDNAQISVDEWCTVQKVPFKQADTLILTPADPRRPIPKDAEIRHIIQLLAGLHVVIGDRLQIAMFGTRPQVFIVEGASPRGALRITPHTAISFRASDFSHEKAFRASYEDIGGLEHELRSVREMIELPLKFPELFSERERLSSQEPFPTRSGPISSTSTDPKSSTSSTGRARRNSGWSSKRPARMPPASSSSMRWTLLPRGERRSSGMWKSGWWRSFLP
jgi:transitional endoplasmic reticulum ATPase